MVNSGKSFRVSVLGLVMLSISMLDAVQMTGSGNNLKIVCSLQRLGDIGSMTQGSFAQKYLPNSNFSIPYAGGSRYCFFEFITDDSTQPRAEYFCGAGLRGTAQPAGFESSMVQYSFSKNNITYKCFVLHNGNGNIRDLFELIKTKAGGITAGDIENLGFKIDFK